MGSDTNPSLCFTMEAFDLLIETWKILIEKNENWEPLIQPGLDKLTDYKYDIDLVPAYYLALGNIFFWALQHQFLSDIRVISSGSSCKTHRTCKGAWAGKVQ